MKYITNLLLIVMVFLSSCSPQRRLQRLLEHHPELMEQTNEPIIVTHTDTFYIDSTKAQTEIAPGEIEKARGRAESEQADQVTIATATTDRATASLIYSATRDRYSLDLETFHDTIIVTSTDTIFVPEVVYKVKKETPLRDTVLGGFAMIIIAIILLLIITYLTKRFLDNI